MTLPHCCLITLQMKSNNKGLGFFFECNADSFDYRNRPGDRRGGGGQAIQIFGDHTRWHPRGHVLLVDGLCGCHPKKTVTDVQSATVPVFGHLPLPLINSRTCQLISFGFRQSPFSISFFDSELLPAKANKTKESGSEEETGDGFGDGGWGTVAVANAIVIVVVVAVVVAIPNGRVRKEGDALARNIKAAAQAAALADAGKAVLNQRHGTIVC